MSDSKRVMILRSVEVDIDQMARRMLVHPEGGEHEVVLELYRWIVNTGGEHGPKWASRDPQKHERFPGFLEVSHLDNGYLDSIGYRGTLRSSDGRSSCWGHVARAITTAALGDHRTLDAWRREMKLRDRTSIPCRIHRAKDGRRYAPVTDVLHVNKPRKLKVQLNEYHADAVHVLDWLLVPGDHGWEFGVKYGGEPGKSGGEWYVVGESRHERQKFPVQNYNEPVGAFIRRCLNFKEEILRS